jgi:outer membrane protein TolC
MSGRAARLVLALACASVAACIKYVPAPLEPEVNARAFAVRGLDDAGLIQSLAGRRDDGGAWGPDDLSLAAWYFRPELEVARRGWATAVAAEVTAGQRPQPGVSVTAVGGEAGPFESPWATILTATIPIELGGKRGARIAAARARSLAAELDARRLAWELASDVRTATLATVQGDSNVAAWRRRVVLSERLATQSERLYEAGGLGRSAVEQASITSRLAERELANAAVIATGARARLAQLVGIPGQALDTVRLRTDAERGCGWVAELGLDSLRTLALRRRYDMGAALARYAVAEGELRVAVAGQYPDLEIGPGFAWEQGLKRWILGLGLPQVLLNRNRGPIGEAIARRAQVASEVDGVQQRILSEVEVSVADCGAIQRASDAAADLVRTVARREQSVRSAFERGETGQFEGLSLALAVADAEAGLQRADLDLALVGTRLTRTTGLWSSSVRDTLPDPMTWPTAVPASSGRSN